MHRHHHHDEAPREYGRAFAIGVVLNVIYVGIEAAFGIWADSLALLADAGHNLSDVLGLLVAWAGYALAKVPPTERRTYGWRGTTILAALFNALTLMVAVGGIAWEAIQRFFVSADVAAPTIIVVAGVGVIINTGTALLFLKGREHDLNLRGAFLHMGADALLSLGVVIAGGLILWTGWAWIDPVTSLVIAAVILWGTWGLFRESANLAIQAVPASIELPEVEQTLRELPGVTAVHDLHVWSMSTTEIALTAHLVRPRVEDEDWLLARAGEEMGDRFGIRHVTIQIERDAERASCNQAEAGTL